jgi:hypothetical protein
MCWPAEGSQNLQASAVRKHFRQHQGSPPRGDLCIPCKLIITLHPGQTRNLVFPRFAKNLLAAGLLKRLRRQITVLAGVPNKCGGLDLCSDVVQLRTCVAGVPGSPPIAALGRISRLGPRIGAWPRWSTCTPSTWRGLAPPCHSPLHTARSGSPQSAAVALQSPAAVAVSGRNLQHPPFAFGPCAQS